MIVTSIMIMQKNMLTLLCPSPDENYGGNASRPLAPPVVDAYTGWGGLKASTIRDFTIRAVDLSLLIGRLNGPK